MKNRAICKKIAVIQHQDVIYYHATEPMKQNFWRSEERDSFYRSGNVHRLWRLPPAANKRIAKDTPRNSVIKGKIISDWVVDE